MKPFYKFVIVVTAVLLLLGIVFFDNIKGYYRFKQYCENEGGLRIYQPLEKNVGWQAEDYDAAHMAAQLKWVSFVRYTDKKNGDTYDLKYLGGYWQSKSSFKKAKSDQTAPVEYQWVNINSFLEGERNLFEFGYEVVDKKSGSVFARYYMYEYLLYVGPFDSRSIESCFREGGESVDRLPAWRLKLNTAFKN